MKVIFLDIDGVIQPTWKQKRFEHLDEMDEMAKRLDAQIPGYEYYRYVTVEKYPGCVFTAYSRKCSLAAVCFDWDNTLGKCLNSMTRKLSSRQTGGMEENSQ